MRLLLSSAECHAGAMLWTAEKHAVFGLDPGGIQTVSRTLIADAQISRGSPRKYDVWFATVVMNCAQRVVGSDETRSAA
jgi:hypothetical protein